MRRSENTQLGIRLPLKEGESMERTFLMRPPLPADTSEEALQQILAEAGWKRPQITRRIFLRGRGHRTLFVIKAEPPTDAAAMLRSTDPNARCKIYNQLYSDLPEEVELEVYRMQSKNRQPNGQPLRLGAWNQSTEAPDGAYDAFMKVDEEESHPGDADPSKADNKRARTEGDSATTQPTQPKQRARLTKKSPDADLQQHKQWLHTNHLSLQDVAGDGNCWYHAIAHFAKKTAAQARQETTQWMKKNAWAAHYTPYQASTQEKWQKHIAEVQEKSGTWLKPALS